MISSIGPWVIRLPGIPGYEWEQGQEGQEKLWRRIRKSQERLARRLSDVLIFEHAKEYLEVRRRTLLN